MMYKSLIAALFVAQANAFAPVSRPFGARLNTQLYAEAFDPGRFGKYDDNLWDNTAKTEIYNMWNPAAPRTVENFNPFETFDGNSPDASGRYPGEPFYKDPQRPDINFQMMMVERGEMEARQANPKPGFTPGCPGCRN